jgi:serine/threonine protein kinase
VVNEYKNNRAAVLGQANGKKKVLKMLAQFKREVRIMYEMNHVHIVKLYNHIEVM